MSRATCFREKLAALMERVAPVSGERIPRETGTGGGAWEGAEIPGRGPAHLHFFLEDVTSKFVRDREWNHPLFGLLLATRSECIVFHHFIFQGIHLKSVRTNILQMPAARIPRFRHDPGDTRGVYWEATQKRFSPTWHASRDPARCD